MKQTEKSIIAIDPSIVQCGWCIAFEGGEVAGLIKPIGETLAERLQSLAVEQKKVCLAHVPFPEKAIVELPSAFTYARSQGQYGKSLNADSLQKLNLAIGVIFGTLHALSIPVEFIPVLWKGKMTKGLAQTITGEKNHNVADAILLARYYLGKNPNRKGNKGNLTQKGRDEGLKRLRAVS